MCLMCALHRLRVMFTCDVQYVPHAPPGYHGTDIYFYSRVAVVHMAIAVALVCEIAILPW